MILKQGIPVYKASEERKNNYECSSCTQSHLERYESHGIYNGYSVAKGRDVDISQQVGSKCSYSGKRE